MASMVTNKRCWSYCNFYRNNKCYLYLCNEGEITFSYLNNDFKSVLPTLRYKPSFVVGIQVLRAKEVLMPLIPKSLFHENEIPSFGPNPNFIFLVYKKHSTRQPFRSNQPNQQLRAFRLIAYFNKTSIMDFS